MIASKIKCEVQAFRDWEIVTQRVSRKSFKSWKNELVVVYSRSRICGMKEGEKKREKRKEKQAISEKVF